MSTEFIVYQGQLGKIGKFIGCGGSFYDVWNSSSEFLGTCGTLGKAHEMMVKASCPGECPEDNMLKSD